MVGPSINSHNLPLKFLCSYGGKILPRHPDGKLRYYGGETRVLSVGRCISFAELLVKLGEVCGASVSLRCQLPTEDLDALVSIKSDEDLANLIEEYDRVSSPKIRAFLSPQKTTKKVVSRSSSIASTSSSNATVSSHHDVYSPKSICSTAASPPSTVTSLRYQYHERCVRQNMMTWPPVIHPLCCREKVAGRKVPQYAAYHGHGNSSGHIYLIHHGNHWQ